MSAGRSEKVSQRTFTGAVTLIISKLAARCIDLGTLIVLGRLLSPADFGIVAIAMSIVVIVEAVTELPMMQALVRLPELTNSHYDTAFSLALVRSIVIAATLAGLSWPAAQIYGDPRLIGLLCTLWIAPAVRGLSSPLLVHQIKRLDYRPFLVSDFFGKVAAFCLATFLAWKTGSYWSIAAGTIIAPLTSVSLSYCFQPYSPRWSLRQWHEFSDFLGWSSAAQVTSALNWQMDQLTLGRFVNAFDLGRYAMAANLSMLPSQVIVTQILSPLNVAFSHIRDDRQRLIAAYRSSAATVVAVGLPIMVGLSIIAPLLIKLVLGEQWLGAVTNLQWLSLAVIPTFFVAPVAPLAMALGRTKALFLLGLAELLFKLPLLFLAVYYYGIPGVLAARVASALVVAGCSMLAVRTLIGLPIWSQLAGAWRPGVSVAAMALAIIPAEGWLDSLDGLAARVAGLAVFVAAAAAIYVGSIFGLWLVSSRPDGIETRIAGLASAFSRKLVFKFGK